jgi:hypothetical protein
MVQMQPPILHDAQIKLSLSVNDIRNGPSSSMPYKLNEQ